MRGKRKRKRKTKRKRGSDRRIICEYCFYFLPPEHAEPPEKDNKKQWKEVAESHMKGCPWVETKGFLDLNWDSSNARPVNAGTKPT